MVNVSMGLWAGIYFPLGMVKPKEYYPQFKK